MELRSLQHEDQKFTYSDHAEVFPTFATGILREILAKWQHIFPREHTLIHSRHNVPSLFVRFDCVITSGQLRIYEVQEGCAWVGYTGVANDEFRKIRDEIVHGEWPRLKVLRADVQSDKDDDLWLERATIAEALESPDPLIVRFWPSRLSAEERNIIIGKSLRPVLHHNNKRYGIHFGWWKPAIWHESDHGASLPWNEPFVLKPLSGHGSKDIMFWKPDDRTGRATRTQIVHTLQRHGKMYLQPFIPPMQTDINGVPYHFLYRPYFIYSGKRAEWVPAHGIWTARPYPNLRLHGASDAISGPLLME